MDSSVNCLLKDRSCASRPDCRLPREELPTLLTFALMERVPLVQDSQHTPTHTHTHTHTHHTTADTHTAKHTHTHTLTHTHTHTLSLSLSLSDTLRYYHGSESLAAI